MELIFSILFERSLDAVGEKKVPLVIRIVLGTLLLLLFGFAVMFVYGGIVRQSLVMIGVGCFIVFLWFLMIWALMKKQREKK